jgi:hypothetical protein
VSREGAPGVQAFFSANGNPASISDGLFSDEYLAGEQAGLR